MQIDYTLGTGDDWSFHCLKCDNVMPQMTDTINDSISHHIDSNEGAQVLVIKNNYNKRIVVGGATNNGTDEKVCVAGRGEEKPHPSPPPQGGV